jgi:hypothetical protein
MNNENLEDDAIRTVREQRDKGDLIASFFLCSAFVEHYCRTRLLIFLTDRPLEIIKITKNRKASIYSKMEKIIRKDLQSQRVLIDVGLLVGAWNNELYDQLRRFNTARNDFAHQYEYLLKILKKDEKEVRDIIDLGLSLLHNIKLGYVKS